MNRKKFAADIIPDRNQRSAVIFLFLMAVPYSYSSGLRAAALIESGARFSYVITPIDGIEIAGDSIPERRVRFLGQVSDHIFFFNPVDQSVSIGKADEKKIMTLKAFSKSEETAHDWLLRIWRALFKQKES